MDALVDEAAIDELGREFVRLIHRYRKSQAAQPMLDAARARSMEACFWLRQALAAEKLEREIAEAADDVWPRLHRAFNAVP